MSKERWRVQIPAELSLIVFGDTRDDVSKIVSELLFESLGNRFSDVDHIEITDLEMDEIFIDPEPLCKCGRLPECCDCDEDDDE